MDAKLNHSDLSVLLAKAAGISQAKAEMLTKSIFDIIIEGLELDGNVKINGLGTFKLTDVASRSSVNVNTGEKFEIQGHKKLVFIPADTLKDSVNQPFAMFEPVEVDETYSDDAEPDNNEIVAEESCVDDDVQPKSNNIAVAEESEPIAEEPIAKVDVPVEQTVAAVVEQPKRPEPVMVHVPKKEKKSFVVSPKKNKRNNKWLYAILSLVAVIAVVALFYTLYITPAKVVCNTQTIETVASNNTATVIKEPTTDAVTGATVDATSGATPQDKKLVENETDIDTIISKPSEPEEYRFVITKELALLDLKSITVADTTLYEMFDLWTEHVVVSHETLTRIALKHYGDKKLWPYIVKYNSMARPDDLRKGMKILIPKLKPRN